MTTRTALVLVPALAAVLLTGCSTGSDTPDDTAVPGLSPAAVPSAAPSVVPSVISSPAARTIDVAFAGGVVTGTDGREEVKLGEQVVLRITSEIAEEYHVHGYDLEGPLPAGQQVEIPVTATIPGVFEVELHDSGKLLFQLRVA